MKRRRAPGKWVEGLGPDQTVGEAAALALGVRLEAVEIMLPLAAERANEGPEHIHQLRVATRRADAAIRLFLPWLDAPRLAKARKRLKRIRRAAGDARECDVHLACLEAWRDEAKGDRRAVLNAIVSWTAKEREVAQDAVREAARRDPVAKLAKTRTRLLETLAGRHAGGPDAAANGVPAPSTYGELAVVCMPTFVQQVRDAAALDLHVIDNLHALRIVGKRLRYAMELFASCLGPGFKASYERVEALQERLGAINDSHEMMHRVSRFMADVGDTSAVDPAAVAALHDALRDDGDALALAFLTEWEAGTWDGVWAVGREVREHERG